MRKLIVTIFVILNLPTFGQTGTIDGTVIDKTDSSNLAGLPIVIVGTRTGVITNNEGYFKLSNLQPGTYDLAFQFISLGEDTVRNVNVVANEVTTLNLGLPIGDCSGNKPKNCPIDGSTSEVIPIIYGLPGNKLMKKAERGKVRLGGCIVTGCDPQWYCERHNHKY